MNKVKSFIKNNVYFLVMTTMFMISVIAPVMGIPLLGVIAFMIAFPMMLYPMTNTMYYGNTREVYEREIIREIHTPYQKYSEGTEIRHESTQGTLNIRKVRQWH